MLWLLRCLCIIFCLKEVYFYLNILIYLILILINEMLRGNMMLFILLETVQELHTLLSRRLSNSFGTAEDPDDHGLDGVCVCMCVCFRTCVFVFLCWAIPFFLFFSLFLFLLLHICPVMSLCHHVIMVRYEGEQGVQQLSQGSTGRSRG